MRQLFGFFIIYPLSFCYFCPIPKKKKKGDSRTVVQRKSDVEMLKFEWNIFPWERYISSLYTNDDWRINRSDSHKSGKRIPCELDGFLLLGWEHCVMAHTSPHLGIVLILFLLFYPDCHFNWHAGHALVALWVATSRKRPPPCLFTSSFKQVFLHADWLAIDLHRF